MPAPQGSPFGGSPFGQASSAAPSIFGSAPAGNSASPFFAFGGSKADASSNIFGAPSEKTSFGKGSTESSFFGGQSLEASERRRGKDDSGRKGKAGRGRGKGGDRWAGGDDFGPDGEDDRNFGAHGKMKGKGRGGKDKGDKGWNTLDRRKGKGGLRGFDDDDAIEDSWTGQSRGGNIFLDRWQAEVEPGKGKGKRGKSSKGGKDGKDGKDGKGGKGKGSKPAFQNMVWTPKAAQEPPAASRPAVVLTPVARSSQQPSQRMEEAARQQSEEDWEEDEEEGSDDEDEEEEEEDADEDEEEEGQEEDEDDEIYDAAGKAVKPRAASPESISDEGEAPAGGDAKKAKAAVQEPARSTRDGEEEDENDAGEEAEDDDWDAWEGEDGEEEEKVHGSDAEGGEEEAWPAQATKKSRDGSQGAVSAFKSSDQNEENRKLASLLGKPEEPEAGKPKQPVKADIPRVPVTQASKSSLPPSKSTPAAVDEKRPAPQLALFPWKQKKSTPPSAGVEDGKREAKVIEEFLKDAVEELVADRGGMKGTLREMCSKAEIALRQESRQVDSLEWAAGSTIERPVANPLLACKKYQRSSADKLYLPDDVRTLPMCARTLWYLITKVIDSDVRKPEMNFYQVHSFMRDRTRAVRVDLHLQQPWSTTTKTYIIAHEVCLRFEILSMYLLTASPDTIEKYDQKMAHKSCSQVMEPLINAYTEARQRSARGERTYISPSEPTMYGYIILLLLVADRDGQKVFEFLPQLPTALLRHPAVSWAIAVASSMANREYGRFLRLYRDADFMSSVIMMPLLDLARQRILWYLVRSTAPVIRDKLKLENLARKLVMQDLDVAEEFFDFHGLEVIELGSGQKIVQLPARKGDTFDVMHNSVLQSSFNEQLGTHFMPMKCSFRKTLDELLRSKYQATGLSRSEIVFGAADSLAVGGQGPVADAPRTPLVAAVARPASITPSPARPRLADKATVPAASPSPIDLDADTTSPFGSPRIGRDKRLKSAEQVDVPEAPQLPTVVAKTSADDSKPISLFSTPPTPGFLTKPDAQPKAALPSPFFGGPQAEVEKGKMVSQSGQSSDSMPSSRQAKQKRSRAPSPSAAEPSQLFGGSLVTGNAASLFSEQGLQAAERDTQGGADLDVVEMRPNKPTIEPAPSILLEKPTKARSQQKAERAVAKKKEGKPTAPAKATYSPGVKAARLFRLSLVFAAWRSQWLAQKRWLSWTQASSPATRRKTPQMSESTARLLRVRGAGRCPSVSTRHAAKHLAIRQAAAVAASRLQTSLRECSACMHRLALVMPPKSEGKFKPVHAVAELLQTPWEYAQEGDNQYLPLTTDAWAARLLQQQLVQQQPDVVVSVLSLQPQEEDASAEALEDIGALTAVLHTLTSPLPSSDLANLLTDVQWKDEAQRLWQVAKNFFRKAASCGTAAPGAGQPVVAVLYALTEEVSGELAASVSEEVARKLSSELGKLMSSLEMSEYDIRAPLLKASCIGFVSSPVDDERAELAVSAESVAEAVAWSIGSGSAQLTIPPERDLQLPERLLRHWAKQYSAKQGSFGFERDLEKLQEAFDAALDACSAELILLMRSLPQAPPEWSHLLHGAHGTLDEARRAIEVLLPAWDAWLAAPSLSAMWTEARMDFEQTIGRFVAPCPDSFRLVPREPAPSLQELSAAQLVVPVEEDTPRASFVQSSVHPLQLRMLTGPSAEKRRCLDFSTPPTATQADRRSFRSPLLHAARSSQVVVEPSQPFSSAQQPSDADSKGSADLPAAEDKPYRVSEYAEMTRRQAPAKKDKSRPREDASQPSPDDGETAQASMKKPKSRPRNTPQPAQDDSKPTQVQADTKEDEGPPKKKQRHLRTSLSDVVKRDSLWSDGLLKAVALLAVKTPATYSFA
eukprot:TRINITY_DN14779_c1_g1_i1.p1 TRINITY_DN14779_c1_g1~~TRINITY_DN14779_c1_g1_i1.p1  ORF type:complete len:1901 (-),score=463.23 TRINITY_DN14779_c1_g1_i1:47-5680(-)